MEMFFQALKSLNNAQFMQNVGIYCTKFLLLKIRLIWSHNWETNQNLRKQQFLAKYLGKISHGKVTNMHSRGRVLAVFFLLIAKSEEEYIERFANPFPAAIKGIVDLFFLEIMNFTSAFKGKYRMQTVIQSFFETSMIF